MFELLQKMIYKFKRQKLGVFVILGAIFWYGQEVFFKRSGASYAGIPETEKFRLADVTHIFRKEGFMLGYSELRGNPLWVTYHLKPKRKNARTHKRPSGFHEERFSIQATKHSDYTHTGYDRGHMAPNHAISTLYGRDAQLETFSMVNITPQKPNLNRKIWQRLESIEINKFAVWFKDVWVITGPIFSDNPKKLKGKGKSSNVQIPKAFYKIYVVPGVKKHSPKQVLAFIIPQGVRGGAPLTRYITTIDEIEKQTNLDFLHKVEDTLEDRLESTKNGNAWRIKELLKIRGRFE
jgi:endonuclease G